MPSENANVKHPESGSVAANLRRLRAEAGLSQVRLGLAAGIDPGQISRWERGQRVPAEALPKLAGALLCMIDDFYAEAPDTGAAA